MTGRLAEMVTGRGTTGLARGRDRGKDELEGKGREFGRKGKQHETRTRKDENNGEGHELGRMAPDMGAGGSHPQAISDPEKEEEKEETRRMRWADCDDDEGKEEEEQETKEEREEVTTGKKETARGDDE